MTRIPHATTKTIMVRRRAAALARSRAVVSCVVFVVVLTPILVGLLVERADQNIAPWSWAYAVAAGAPALGIVIAVLSLVVVLWRRSRPVLRIDDHVRIRHSGVSFPVAELATVQLWSQGDSFVTLLPAHVTDRVESGPDARRTLAPYTVRLPRGMSPRPFELGEALQRRRTAIEVDRLGSL